MQYVKILIHLQHVLYNTLSAFQPFLTSLSLYFHACPHQPADTFSVDITCIHVYIFMHEHKYCLLSFFLFCFFFVTIFIVLFVSYCSCCCCCCCCWWWWWCVCVFRADLIILQWTISKVIDTVKGNFPRITNSLSGILFLTMWPCEIFLLCINISVDTANILVLLIQLFSWETNSEQTSLYSGSYNISFSFSMEFPDPQM